MPMGDTIAALSSGGLPSGVAVIRLSGPSARTVFGLFGLAQPAAREAGLRTLRDPVTSEPLDQALVLWFPGPRSFTGEDCVELQVHGGRAVVSAILRRLSEAGIRLAEAGEFTRRAFENGKMNLLEVEALADLVAAETEQQRRQAVHGLTDGLSARCAVWRQGLISVRAKVEATIDFSDEDDVEGEAEVGAALSELRLLIEDIERATGDLERGLLVRDGVRVAICGAPNAGKSSLMNRLAAREVSLVTAMAGTTRDAIDVSIDLGGLRFLITDLAGLRETDDPVELLGIARARDRIRTADLVLWLTEDRTRLEMPVLATRKDAPIWIVRTKSDLWTEHQRPAASGGRPEFVISVVSGVGLDALLGSMERWASDVAGGESPAVIVRERHRAHLLDTLDHLRQAEHQLGRFAVDVAAELLRLGTRGMDRLTGLIDVEDVLDALFREFCIGK